MGKLVVLKFGAGSFDQGFSVSLQIGEEGHSPSVQMSGYLPPFPTLPVSYEAWQTSYKALGMDPRLFASSNQITNVSSPSPQACLAAAETLRSQFNRWLRSQEFLPLREKCLAELHPTDELRVVIQTDHPDVQRLPWHRSEFLERYSRAEIALSTPQAQRHNRPAPQPQVRILAILGHSQGIDVEADRRMLEQLPEARVTFLVEPKREELTDKLWEQPWDILFFAGHSVTHANQSGVIYINPQESLPVAELRHSLQAAIARGLRLAIFNSCDGLGLAWDLAALQLPQTIVMREPVPDRVAQAFLKSFLTAFSQGQSLYLSVRQARQRLEALEDQFPCATWLPVICQNLAEMPPTWNDLDGRQRFPTKRQLLAAGLASLLSAGTVVGIRQLGWLQPWELQAYDHLLRMRSIVAPEPPDGRLLVVEVTDGDLRAQGDALKGDDKTLSNQHLLALLNQLEHHGATVIGLDLKRDPEGAPAPLVQKMQQMQNLIGTCQSKNGNTVLGGRPAQGLPNDRVSFADAAVGELDNVVRRHILHMGYEPGSPCPGNVGLSLGLKLASRYLRTEKGYEDDFLADGSWLVQSPDKRRQTIIQPLLESGGGYQQLEQPLEGGHVAGNQLLINYRDPSRIPKVSLQDVLRNRVFGKDDRTALKGRIVLIGVTHSKSDDKFITPFDQGGSKTPGVMIQAEMVSQLVSAVLDQRPLLQPLPWWGDWLWLVGWAGIGGFVMVLGRSPIVQGSSVLLISGLVYGSSLGLLIQSTLWVPLVPPIIAVVLASGATALLLQHRSIKLH